MKFYDEHKSQKDEFQILAFNLDHDVESMDELERRLQPVVSGIWQGRHLPFPSLLDSTPNTLERFGIGGFPTILLVDPQGHVVKDGNLQMLRNELKKLASEIAKCR